MKHMRTASGVIILTLCFSLSFAEDTWTTYRTNIVDTITALAVENNTIWIGTPNGLAAYDKTTGTSVAYTTDDGLIDNRINAIAIEPDGVVWIATERGISKFDGVSFTSFDNLELRAMKILGAAVDLKNNKWFISSDTVIEYDNETWTVYNIENGLPVSSLTTIAVDRKNTVWIGTNKKGIVSFNETEWSLNDEYRENIVSIAIGDNNTKWFGEYHGSVISFDDEHWDQTQIINSMWFLFSLAVTPDNTLWASTNMGLYRISNGEKQLYDQTSGLERSYCRAIVSDRSGDLWIAGYCSLTRFDGERFTNYLGFTGPSGKTIYSIAIDHDNVKWFGHNTEYISNFNDTYWSGFRIDGYENIGESIVVDSNNVKWFSAGWDGAVNYNGSDIGTLEIKGQNAYETYYNIYTRWLAVDSNNILYLATSLEDDDTLFLQEFFACDYIYKNDQLIPFSNFIVSIAVDSQNNIWALKPYRYNFSRNTFGVYYYDGVLWYSKLLIKDFNMIINKIYIDSNDTIWGLSDTGITFNDGSEWIIYTTYNSGLVSDNVLSITIDHNNTKWIGTDSGVCRFDGETWTTFNTSNSGLCDNKVNCIAVEKNNTIWFGTDNGVSRYTGEVIITSVDENETKPETLPVIRSYPNPFNPSTTIEFTLPEAGLTKLSVYNIAGQKVRGLVSGNMTAGNHTVVWDGRDDSGAPVSAGIYFARLTCGGRTVSGKMVMVK
ncbi:T9SS type A sorting domain-containing protein [bacterium]|nr:T9SS type A sorting domain-containing protein [bacterium]